jgi:hypothetical protein
MTAMAKIPKNKSQSLGHPGQSLDEKIDRVVLDDFMGYYLLATGLWLLAILEWLSKIFHYPRMPVAYTVAAATATGLCVVKFVRTKREVRNLRLGRDGEREVAEILDDLKRYGAEVLHDIPEEQGNVDHVVICTRGIFVIETKNWSKPDKVWEMQFDGQQIHIPTRAPDAAPIIQCKAEAASIKSLLRASTSKAFPVRGVVVFLDWYVKRRPAARGADIWVLNPKEVAGWICNEPEILSDSDVAMATLHLKQYVKKLAA